MRSNEKMLMRQVVQWRRVTNPKIEYNAEHQEARVSQVRLYAQAGEELVCCKDNHILGLCQAKINTCTIKVAILRGYIVRLIVRALKFVRS